MNNSCLTYGECLVLPTSNKSCCWIYREQILLEPPWTSFIRPIAKKFCLNQREQFLFDPLGTGLVWPISNESCSIYRDQILFDLPRTGLVRPTAQKSCSIHRKQVFFDPLFLNYMCIWTQQSAVTTQVQIYQLADGNEAIWLWHNDHDQTNSMRTSLGWYWWSHRSNN